MLVANWLEHGCLVGSSQATHMDEGTKGPPGMPNWLTILQIVATLGVTIATAVFGFIVNEQKHALDNVASQVSQLQTEYQREEEFSKVIRSARASLGTTSQARKMIDVAGLYSVTNSIHEKCIVTEVMTALPNGDPARSDLETLIGNDPQLLDINKADQLTLSRCVRQLRPHAESLGKSLEGNSQPEPSDSTPRIHSSVEKTLTAITLPTSVGWIYVGDSLTADYRPGTGLDRSKITTADGKPVLEIKQNEEYILSANANLRKDRPLGTIIGILPRVQSSTQLGT